MSAGKATEF